MTLGYRQPWIAKHPRLSISELELASWTVLHTAGSHTWNEERPSLLCFSLRRAGDHLAIL